MTISIPENLEKLISDQVQAGIEDLDHGRSEPWDTQAIKANGRRVMQERSSHKS